MGDTRRPCAPARPGGSRRPVGRRAAWILSAGLAGVVAVGALVWGGTVYADSAPIANHPDPDATALAVNGTAVPFRAVSIAMARERSTIVSDSGNAASSSPDFWQTKAEGTTPAERLVDRAREDVVRLQVQLELAQQSGVEAPTAYPQVLQAWQLENDRRAEALRTGKPVYGPQQFSESDYLDYFTGNLAQATESALVKQGRVDDSEAGARRFQRAHQDRFPGAFDTIRQQVTMAYVESQYTELVNRRVGRTSVRGTALLTELPRYRCVADGSC